MERRTFFVTTALVTTALSLLHGCSGSEPAQESKFNEGPPPAPPPASQVQAPPTNTITSDAGTADPTATCEARPPADFVPVWRPPTNFGQRACDTKQIRDYFDKCLVPAAVQSSSCVEFENQNKTCIACLKSDDNSTKLGPVVFRGNNRAWSLNTPGCVARYSNAVGPRDCGAAKQANLSCKQASCAGCTKVPGATQNDVLNCQAKASVSETCQQYVRADSTACNTVDVGPCAPTSGQEEVVDIYQRIARLFCADGN